MVWRLGALFISIAVHYLLLDRSDQFVAEPTISGGSQVAALALSLSVASQRQPVREPPKSKAVQQPRPKSPSLLSNGPPKWEAAEEKVAALASKRPLAPRTDVGDQLKSGVQAESEVQAESVEESLEAELTAAATTTVVQQPGLESLPVVRAVRYRQPPQPPVYPKAALRRRHQGEVLIHALVNEQGQTEEVVLVDSSGYALLDESALRAVSAWAFEAAAVNGVSMKAWIEVPVVYQIN